MGRKVRIKISWTPKDKTLRAMEKLDLNKLSQEVNQKTESIIESLSDVYTTAQQMYEASDVDPNQLRRQGLLSLQDAYDYLRSKGYNISFRAFGGRIERGNLPSIKIGKKRFVPVEALDHLLELQKGFYTIKEAYEKYKEYDPSITLRAFIGRVEKGSVPSIKVNGRRLIPKVAGDAFVVLAKNYYTVAQAVDELRKHGINIRRNAFERRLDRRCIPFVKVGGKRYIAKEVMDQLIEQELAWKNKRK